MLEAYPITWFNCGHGTTARKKIPPEGEMTYLKLGKGNVFVNDGHKSNTT